MKSEIKGIIVSYQAYREYDAILHVLAESGKIYSLIVRGVSKITSKMAGTCQLFTYALFHIKDVKKLDLQTVHGVELIDAFTNIRSDLLKQVCASYICEIANLHHFEENIFPLVSICLKSLEKEQKLFTILALFQACMNRIHGIEPCVDECVICGCKEGISSISIRDGGFVCNQCQIDQHHYQRKQLKYFRMSCKAQMEHLPILLQQDAYTFADFYILYEFFYEYVGVSIKSVRFIKHLVEM